jgi:hypothetical protein
MMNESGSINEHLTIGYCWNLRRELSMTLPIVIIRQV